MLGEIDRLQALLTQAIDERNQQAGAAAMAEAYNVEADLEIARLEDLLRASEERARQGATLTLTQIAEQHPQIPELTLAIEKLRPNTGQRQRRIEALLARLPRVFTWASDTGEIAYGQPFLHVIVDLEKEELDLVIGAVEQLATEGPTYPALMTRKLRKRIPFTPVSGFSSRAARELRITWSKDGMVTIHWAYRRGDSRVGDSEA